LYGADAGLKPVRLRRLSLVCLIETLQLWWDRSEQRQHLARLDHRMLRDIGVSHVDAYRESRKWFWQD
jgi:uncharacterized protein YjiS (DUF1127 family)